MLALPQRERPRQTCNNYAFFVADSRPKVALIDTDESADIDEAELAHHFKRIKREHEMTPADVIKAEDQDNDGRISWDEFTGPKGPRKPPRVKFAAPQASAQGFMAPPKTEL